MVVICWVGAQPTNGPGSVGGPARLLGSSAQGPGMLGRAQGPVASSVGRPAGRPGRGTPGALTPPNRPRAICRLSANPANHDHLLVIWQNHQFPGIGCPWPTDLAPSLPGAGPRIFLSFFWKFKKIRRALIFFLSFCPHMTYRSQRQKLKTKKTCPHVVSKVKSD